MLETDFAMRDAVERVVGTVPYVVNLSLPDMQHARALRSVYPHALIRSIDVSAAAAMPGVVAVVTGADLDADETITPWYGVQRTDQPILAIGKTRYAGEPVALVIADSLSAADAAVRLIDVDYDELPVVETAKEARRSGAPALHDAWPDNSCGAATLRHGDIELGWAESDHVFENEYHVPSASHVPLEPFVTAANWAGDRLEVWTAAQAPHAVRQQLAAIFQLELDQVQVRTQNLGGAFGAKGQIKIEPLTAYAARIAGKPVKLELRRDESFFTTARHAAHVRIRTGVKRDGTLAAREVEILWNAGAYATMTPVAVIQGMARSPGPYRIPHVAVDSRAYYTNTVPTGPFRGAMTTQVCWAYETQMDEIANALAIDPVELRRRNLLVDGDEYATGEAMHDVHFLELVDDAARAIEWGSKGTPAPPGRARGKGLAVMLKSTLTPSRSEARVHVNTDGDITVHSSSVEMGQGANATVHQIAADALNLPPEDIAVPFPDTDITPFDTTTSSSRSTHAMGAAVSAAARNLLDRLTDLAATQLEVEPYDLEHRDGAVFVRGSPQTGKRYGEVLTQAGLEELTGLGTFQSSGGLDPETGQGVHSVHWHQAAAAVEVEVDLETGLVEVLRCHGSSWAGRVVSPHRARQQNEGCAIWGIGQALLEEVVYDNGQMVNPNLAEYMVPSILDVPLQLTTSELGSSEPDAEMHGLGEMVVPAMPPAVGNAIFQAIGLRLRDLPLTPERVLRALKGEAGQ